MSLWSRAADVAQQTPDSRNRLVDFLRAASILAVISGHWLLSAPYVIGDEFRIGNMMDLAAYTKWLSWLFQVMPLFFLVGGYANGVSWRAAERDGRPFSAWLDSRLRRLILPVLTLISAWVLIATAARALGIPADLLQAGSKIALVPIWFLAIYTLIVLLVPVTHSAWKRWGFASFLVPAALAIADDVVFFSGFEAVGWFNYLFIWVAVHQLGYAWLDNRMPSALARLSFGAFGIGLLIGLTVAGPYPVAMISVPDATLSNTLPPKLPLLALAIAQTGFVLSAESWLRRWLGRPSPWTITVLLNGMIMTIYLWHSTALTLIMAAAAGLGYPGLAFFPGTAGWWLTRPIWLVIYALALTALMPMVARFERIEAPERHAAAWRQIAGAICVCAGLALLALFGIGGEIGWLAQVSAIATPFIGALLGGLLITRKVRQNSRST